MKNLGLSFCADYTSHQARFKLSLLIVLAAFHGFVQSAELPAMEYYPRMVEVEQHPDRITARETGEIDFSLFQGDYVEGGSRAMVRERLPTTLNKHEWVYYSFSVRIGSEWPFKENKEVLLMQWRNGAGGPYFAIFLMGEQFYIRRSSDPLEKYFSTADLVSANIFLVNAIWSELDDGRLIVKINGDEVLNYEGPTLHYNDKKPHFSFGIYRPQWNGMEADLSNKISMQFIDFEFGKLDGSKPEYHLSQVSEKSPPAPPFFRVD